MGKTIPLNESKNLHPEQWVKVYGVTCDNEIEYINTCQVYKIEDVEDTISPGWFKEIAVEPVDEGDSE